MKNKWPTEDILARLLNREASDQDIQAWEQASEFDDLRRMLDTAEDLQVPAKRSQAEAWARLQDRIEAGETLDMDVAVVKPLFPKQGIWATAIAAAITLLVMVFYLGRPTEVMTTAGQQLTVNLPDGSRVQLNENSQLRYDEHDWEANRMLSLSGEAFFDVAKGDSFVVKTPDGQVTVLGTEFNVYTRNGQFAVACFEGRVAVELVKADESAVLHPGSFLEKGPDNSAIIRKLDMVDQPGWLTGEYHYQEAPLAEVLSEMTRRYQVTFDVDKAIPADAVFSGVFYFDAEHASPEAQLTQALDMVVGIMGYQYEREGQVVHIRP